MTTHRTLTKNLTVTALVIACLAGSSNASYATQALEEQPTAYMASSEQQATTSIRWGIRPSFVSYIGGHHLLDEGATEHNKIYSFPTQDVQGNEQHLEIRGSGKVQFAEYCADKNDTDTCKLDLTLSNPRIVLDSQGESSLTYTIRTRNYSSGELEGPHEIKMAVLDLRGATQIDDGSGIITWKNIGANLTEEGAHAFSNFYDPGAALASLDFSYNGPKLDFDASGFSIKESWSTGFEYDKVHKLYDVGGKLVHLGVSTYDPSIPTATVLDAKTMQPLSTTSELPLNGYLAAAADAETGSLYIYNKAQQTVEKYIIDDGKLVLANTVAKIDAQNFTIMALGYNPYSKEIGLLGIDGKGSGSLIFVTQEGEVTTQQVPDVLDVSPTLKTASEKGEVYQANYYGETYSFLRPGRVLEPLSDGSFVWNPASTAQYSEGSPIMRGYLLQLSRTGVKEVVQTVPAQGTGSDMRSLKVVGDYVMQWNQNSGSESKVRILKFNGESFEIFRDTAQLPHGISSIAGMTFDGENFVVVDADTGKIYWLDEQFNITADMSISNTKNSNQNVPLLLETVAHDVIVPTVIEDQKTYSEITHLVRLEKYVRDPLMENPKEDKFPDIEDIEEPASETEEKPLSPSPSVVPEENFAHPVDDTSPRAPESASLEKNQNQKPLMPQAPAAGVSSNAGQPQTPTLANTLHTSAQKSAAEQSSRLAHTGVSNILIWSAAGLTLLGAGIAVASRRKRNQLPH